MPTAGGNPVPRMRRWSGGSIAIATAIHAAVAAAFLHALAAPRDLDWIVAARARPDTPSTSLRYVAIQRERPLPIPVTDRSTPPTMSHARELAPAPLPASEATDSGSIGTPAAAASTGTVDAPATLDATGAGGVVLVPESADPRIWSTRSLAVAAEPSRAEVLEGSLARGIRASNDSIAALGVQTVRPDWVARGEGGSYGVDNSRIHLGKVSLPAVLLGALPIPGFGCMPMMYFPDRPVRDSVGISCLRLENPNVAERAERIGEMSAEIRASAALTAAAREEIARINARKERERGARRRTPTSVPPGSPIARPP